MTIIKETNDGRTTYTVTDENGFRIHLTPDVFTIDGVRLKCPLSALSNVTYMTALTRMFHELYDMTSWDGDFQTECDEARRDALDRE